MVNRGRIGRQGEDAVVAEIRRVGGTASNLNVSLKHNYPVIDVAARLNGARMLIQVRATTYLKDIKFTAFPQETQAVAALAATRGCHGIWAFVCLVNGTAVITYDTASRVDAPAQQDEINYLGTNRYHSSVNQFAVGIHRIGELLAPAGLTA